MGVVKPQLVSLCDFNAVKWGQSPSPLLEQRFSIPVLLQVITDILAGRFCGNDQTQLFSKIRFAAQIGAEFLPEGSRALAQARSSVGR